MEIVDRQREALEAESAERQSSLSSSVSPWCLWEDLDFFCRMAASQVDQLAPRGKRRLLQNLVEEVRVDTVRKTAMVMAHVPESPAGPGPVRRAGGELGPSSGLLSTISRRRQDSPKMAPAQPRDLGRLVYPNLMFQNTVEHLQPRVFLGKTRTFRRPRPHDGNM